MTLDEFNRRNPVRFVPPSQCWCGASNRGAEDHLCPECLVHCELAAHRDGRLSPRAEALHQIRTERLVPA